MVFAYMFRIEHQFGPAPLTHLDTPLTKARAVDEGPNRDNQMVKDVYEVLPQLGKRGLKPRKHAGTAPKKRCPWNNPGAFRCLG